MSYSTVKCNLGANYVFCICQTLVFAYAVLTHCALCRRQATSQDCGFLDLFVWVSSLCSGIDKGLRVACKAKHRKASKSRCLMNLVSLKQNFLIGSHNPLTVCLSATKTNKWARSLVPFKS